MILLETRSTRYTLSAVYIQWQRTPDHMSVVIFQLHRCRAEGVTTMPRRHFPRFHIAADRHRRRSEHNSRRSGRARCQRTCWTEQPHPVSQDCWALVIHAIDLAYSMLRSTPRQYTLSSRGWILEAMTSDSCCRQRL